MRTSGRRIEKELNRRIARASDAGTAYAYQWEGDRLIAEAPMTADGAVAWDRARHWVYEPGSFRPLAQAADTAFIIHDPQKFDDDIYWSNPFFGYCILGFERLLKMWFMQAGLP